MARITLNQAINYISEFKAKEGELAGFACGGTISKCDMRSYIEAALVYQDKVFESHTHSSGSGGKENKKESKDSRGFHVDLNATGFSNFTGHMAWFCYNRAKINGPSAPEEHDNKDWGQVFLAFEEFTFYDPGQPPAEPEQEVLKAPYNIFTIDQPVDETFLRGHTVAYANVRNLQISKSKTFLFKARFEQKRPNSKKIGHGFFVNNGDLQGYLDDPTIKHIRYYFGYGSDPQYGKNKIRVILVPVDENYRNLTPEDSDSVDEQYYLLQKAWPPPEAQ